MSESDIAMPQRPFEPPHYFPRCWHALALAFSLKPGQHVEHELSLSRSLRAPCYAPRRGLRGLRP
eukprot:1923308-Pleurochrysis_carterae.AAC.1